MIIHIEYKGLDYKLGLPPGPSNCWEQPYSTTFGWGVCDRQLDLYLMGNDEGGISKVVCKMHRDYYVNRMGAKYGLKCAGKICLHKSGIHHIRQNYNKWTCYPTIQLRTEDVLETEFWLDKNKAPHNTF